MYGTVKKILLFIAAAAAATAAEADRAYSKLPRSRVLLMNNDEFFLAPVTLQSYADKTNETSKTGCAHSGKSSPNFPYNMT